LRAPSSPLRGEQPPAQAARAGGIGLLRNLPGRPPRRADRAAGPPVLRRLPVPPGVQVAAAAPAAAVPRVRARIARTRAWTVRRGGSARGSARGGRIRRGFRPRRARRPTLHRLTVATAPRASRAEKERVVRDFVRLCEIESPSGRERAVADAVADELRQIGLQPTEDGTGAEIESDAGNVLARVP